LVLTTAGDASQLTSAPFCFYNKFFKKSTLGFILAQLTVAGKAKAILGYSPVLSAIAGEYSIT